MIGKPKYKYGDTVRFKIGESCLIGKVEIIDRYGTFFDDSDVSYDIMVEKSPHFDNRPCLYKHISEKDVEGAVLDETN
ncbi:MAG: hypothetical protein Q4B60_09040 [Erysipelotrichaceae bacterium]|nr:hypothetical protein [Erysipelotrichaceae bacterium]